MVLEATMICIDNSDWMRNGDYSPSRLQAQSDAISLICGAKTQSNPENTVGILTMAGKGVRVLATPTSDLGKILGCMHELEMGGEVNIAAGIQVAQLALKHRQNKNQQQRIVVFVGSPLKYEKRALEMIGKRLKKNSVALDIVDFGEEDDGKPEKLEALLAAVNNNDTSHIVHVPPGANPLSDVLISTPVFTGDEGGSGFASLAAGGAAGFEFGVDPNVDPELALALRVSMEEERARQEAAAKKAAEESSSKAEDATMTDHDDASTGQDKLVADDVAPTVSTNISGSGHEVDDSVMKDAASEDPELALALQMSMQESNHNNYSKSWADPTALANILANLPGVDPNDPALVDILAPLLPQPKSPEKKDDDNEPSNENK